MIRKLILVVVLTSLVGIMFAQTKDNFIKTEYKQKSAAKAMMMSAIFPGAGQFYSNKMSITAYIFPVIEAGMWYGYLKYRKKGKDIEKDYEYYATDEVIGHYDSDSPAILGVAANEGDYYHEGDPIYRYERWRQYVAQENFKTNAQNPFYDNHFRLDGIGDDGQLTENNSQHFYEDIAKYDKYLFGWFDWFTIYGEYQEDWTDYNFHWIFQEDVTGEGNKWYGNTAYNDTISYYLQDQANYDAKNGMYSTMRAKYIVMRQDAEDNFKKSRLFSYGIIFNHIFSVIDAVRVTKQTNIKYLSENKVKLGISPVLTENGITPYISISKRFY